MTKDDLFERVWKQAPPAKFFVGRRGFREVVERVVDVWQSSALRPSDRGNDASYSARLMIDAVSARYSTIWLILFQALITFAVQALIEWWFASSEVRSVMTSWQQELHNERC